MAVRSAILNTKFHDFEEIKIQNGVVLAKCNCCSPPRLGVFVANNDNKIFRYHGYDPTYARKLFSSLLGQRGGDND